MAISKINEFSSYIHQDGASSKPASYKHDSSTADRTCSIERRARRAKKETAFRLPAMNSAVNRTDLLEKIANLVRFPQNRG